MFVHPCLQVYGQSGTWELPERKSKGSIGPFNPMALWPILMLSPINLYLYYYPHRTVVYVQDWIIATNPSLPATSTGWIFWSSPWTNTLRMGLLVIQTYGMPPSESPGTTLVILRCPVQTRVVSARSTWQLHIQSIELYTYALGKHWRWQHR